MKTMKSILGLFVLAITAFFAFGCESASAESYITIDINPSVELIVNRRDRVVMANALNEDGETLLLDLSLIGMKIEDATELLIDKAIELGFIDVDSEETVVNVTSYNPNSSYGAKLGERIRQRINKAFLARAMFGYAMIGETPEEIRLEAEELGVSPGKLRLVKIVQSFYPDITVEDGLAMPVKDLMDLLKDKNEEIKDIVTGLREEFQEARKALFDEYVPQIQALEEELSNIEALIAETTDETELETLEAQLEAKREEFQVLHEAFRAALDALLEQYTGMSAPMRQEMMEQHQNRIMEHQARVAQFRAQMAQRKAMMEQIRQFQQNQIRPRP